jgi:hypothetical protein
MRYEIIFDPLQGWHILIIYKHHDQPEGTPSWLPLKKQMPPVAVSWSATSS